VEAFFGRCGLDPASCHVSGPVRTTRIRHDEGDGTEAVDETVTTDLTDHGLRPDEWSGLSWSARRDACEWLEQYHEVRVEIALLSPEHRRRFETEAADGERPGAESLPSHLMELICRTAEPGFSPRFAALGHRF
jgi:hypothetical protein